MKIDDKELELPYDKQRDYVLKKAKEKTEGGKGSGNVGHSGIPGHRGGSLPKGVKNPIAAIGKKVGGLAPNQGAWATQDTTVVSEPDNAAIGTVDTPADSTVIDMSKYGPEFSQISQEQRLEQATMEDITAQMERDLEAAREGREIKLQDVSGELNADSLKAIVSNGRATLDAYTGYLSAETYAMARDALYDMESIFGSEEFKGKKAEDINALVQDTINKLVFQEVESVREQYTDHGIRHLMGNYERGMQIAECLSGGELTSMERLQMLVTTVNHDLGYATPLVRMGGDRGIQASTEHKLYSQKLWAEQIDQWDKDKIFSEEEFLDIDRVIRNHDQTGIDARDVSLTAFSLSDNLSLFAKEKLPSMFRNVDGSRDCLIVMTGLAKRMDKIKDDFKAGRIDQATYDQAKSSLQSRFSREQSKLFGLIDKSKLSDAFKRDLRSAVKRANFVSPKKSIGVLAGDITKISGKGHVNVEITFNEFDRFLQQRFNMGQTQARKVLSDYGVKDFSQTKYELGEHVTITVVGVK